MSIIEALNKLPRKRGLRLVKVEIGKTASQ